MRGITHLQFGISVAAVSTSVVLRYFPEYTPHVAVASVGLVYGALAPDVDAPNSLYTATVRKMLKGRPPFKKRAKGGNPFWFVAGLVGLVIWVSLLPLAGRHRGATHSVAWMLFTGAGVAVASQYPYIGAFLVGLGLGMKVHADADSLTVSEGGVIKTGSIADAAVGWVVLVGGLVTAALILVV